MPSYDKKTLEEIVKSSTSYTEVLRKLRMCTTGSSHDTIKKYCKLWLISVDHFLNNSQRLKLEPIQKLIPLEEILKENSTYNRGHLKKRLFKIGLKQNICEFCGQDETWRDKKLSLILDHINGVNNDNRLENLRILCPNCNATLDTHCGRKKCNRKKLQEKIYIYRPRLDKRKVVRPSLEQLLEETNQLGFSAVGRKYNVSDNAIRKWISSGNKS